MNFKRKLLTSLLSGAILALPIGLPAFVQPSYGADSGNIQQVDWWWDHYKGDRDEYANHGWHKGYYEYGGQRYACERARGLQEKVWREKMDRHPREAEHYEEEAAEARAFCYDRD